MTDYKYLAVTVCYTSLVVICLVYAAVTMVLVDVCEVSMTTSASLGVSVQHTLTLGKQRLTYLNCMLSMAMACSCTPRVGQWTYRMSCTVGT